MPVFTTKKSSAARDRLAECISARQDAEAKAAGIQSSLDRLADHEQAVVAARRELATLDDAEAAATLDWAKSNEGDAPTTDVERRESIARALVQAESQARAAVTARSALAAELEAATRQLPGISAWSNVFVAQIVCEEIESLLADMIETQRSLAAKIERVRMMREFVIVTAERLPKASEEARQVYVSAEAIGQEMQRAMSPHEAPLDDAAAARTALRDFVGALADDASVNLAA